MKKIVLLTVPSSTNRTPEECLGLEYIASESIANGHTVSFIDAWMNKLSIEEITSQILKINPDIIGMSPSMDSIENTKVLTINLRNIGYKGQIIMGGIYASFEAKSIVSDFGSTIDGVLTGEADSTFQTYANSGTLVGVPGGVYIKNGNIIIEPRLCVTNNLDELPFPTRDSISTVIASKTPSHVMGSRGCYGNCSFCSVACFQKFSSDKRWRGRSADSIVSELKYLVNKGETMVKFIDDNWFGGRDKTREMEIAKKIQESGIIIRFRISLRVNDVTDELIKELKKSGLFAVSLGVESFVQRKLNDYNKGTTVEDNLNAVSILEKNRIFIQMGHIMFDPFITLPEIEQELLYLKKTSWAITKGICTQIFAAEGTKITERIRMEIGFKGKQGTNYLYKIQDYQAKLFYDTIKPWTRYSSNLYDMVIDPISAPKNVPIKAHMAFHKLYLLLRKIDLEIADKLIKKIKNGNIDSLDNVSMEMMVKYAGFLAEINNEASILYKDNGLVRNTNINCHIY